MTEGRLWNLCLIIQIDSQISKDSVGLAVLSRLSCFDFSSVSSFSGFWLNAAACSFLATRQSMHFWAGSGREQDRTTQRWPVSQEKTRIRLKRNRHLARSSSIWPAGTSRIRRWDGCWDSRFLQQFAAPRTPIACNVYVSCMPVLIGTPSEWRVVINNQNQCLLRLPTGVSAGQKVASSFTVFFWTETGQRLNGKRSYSLHPFYTVSNFFWPQHATAMFLTLNFMKYSYSSFKITGQILSLAPAKPTWLYH